MRVSVCLIRERERERTEKNMPRSSSHEGKRPLLFPLRKLVNELKANEKAINEISHTHTKSRDDEKYKKKKPNNCHVLQLNGHWMSQNKKVEWCVVGLVYH